MNHPLDGSRLKLARAKEHLNALNLELAKYLASEPGQLIQTRTSSMVTITPTITAVPPLRLSTIVGDCVINLSAALDYIAWQLALKYWIKKPVAGKDRVYFHAPNTLKKNGMDATALDLVERLQPNNGGDKYLRVLHGLVNEDKHRLPLLTLARIGCDELSVSVQVGDKIARAMTSANITSISVSHGGEFGTETVNVQTDGDIFVNVNLRSVGSPSEPIEQTIMNIVKCVEKIVLRFENFFP